MKKLRRFLKSEKGSVAVIAAVAFVAVSAFTGLTIDLGKVYMRGSAMQGAADAAAYSVSDMLPFGMYDSSAQAAVDAQITSYIEKNGFDVASIDIIEYTNPLNGEYTGVRVTMQNDVSYSFGPIVGVDGTTVVKAAAVGLEAVSQTSGVVPVGMQESDFDAAMAENGAQNVTVKYGGGGGETGFFGALDLDGSKGGGANDFRDRLANGYGGLNYIGQEIPTENGNMAGPTAQAFEARYNACTHFPGDGGCTAAHFVDNCPRVTYMVIYEQIGKHDVRINGFAPFILVGMQDGDMLASHVDIKTFDGDTTDLTGNNVDYGLFKVKLKE